MMVGRSGGGYCYGIKLSQQLMFMLVVNVVAHLGVINDWVMQYPSRVLLTRGNY